MKTFLRCGLAFGAALILSACAGDETGATPTPGECGRWPDTVSLPADLSGSVVTDVVALSACSLVMSGYAGASNPLNPAGNTRGFVLNLLLDADGRIQQSWRYTLDTASTDVVTGVDLDQTTLRFLGWTTGVVSGATASGKSDVVIGELRLDGTQVSLSQLGDARPNRPLALLTPGTGDALLVGNDDVYVPTNYVEAWEDPWLAALSTVGNAYQIGPISRAGTEGSDRYDAALALSTDAALLLAWGGNGGMSTGLVIEKRDVYGNLLTTSRLSQSPYDRTASLIEDTGGAIFVFGTSYEDLGAPVGNGDLFLAELSADSATPLRISQFGSEDVDWATALVSDGAALYAVSEVLRDTSPSWQLVVYRLSRAGEVLEHHRLDQSAAGVAQAATIVGTQLVVAGARGATTAGLRGTLYFMPLTPTSARSSNP
jgi:hypothetical protein